MSTTDKKPAEKTAKTDYPLSTDHGHETKDKPWGVLHFYSFTETAGAKVWPTQQGDPDTDAYSIAVLDGDRRVLTDSKIVAGGIDHNLPAKRINELLNELAETATAKPSTEG